MIAEQPYEPYIYIGEIKRDAGVLIRWLEKGSEVNDAWMLYADFEREKLKCLHGLIALGCGLEDCGYFFKPDGYAGPCYNSGELIGYQFGNWFADSESSRLLKRAEFLKAVCEKEGVEWLAKDDSPSQLIIDAAKETAKVMSLARGETKCACTYPCHVGCACNCHEGIERTDGTRVKSDMICGCSGEGKPKFIDGHRCCRNCGYPESYAYPKPMVVIGNEFEAKPERDYYTKVEMQRIWGSLLDELHAMNFSRRLNEWTERMRGRWIDS